MKKDLRVKIASYVIASAIAFINTYCIMFTSVAFAADDDIIVNVEKSPYSSWVDSDVSDLAKELADAYFDFYKNIPRDVSNRDFTDIFNNSTQIPIAWLKIVTNSQGKKFFALCPVDDVYYYLNNTVLECYDPKGRTGRSGGGGDNRFKVSNASDLVFTSDFFKSKIDYWGEYYQPKANVDQYTYGYQSASVKKDSKNLYMFSPWVPVYLDNAGSKNGWGAKSWSGGVYLLPYIVDDDLNNGLPYYSEYYFYITSERDENKQLFLVVSEYKLLDNSLVKSDSYSWDTSTANCLSLTVNESFFYLYYYPSYFDYLNNKSPKSFGSFNTRSFRSGFISGGSSVSLSSFVRNRTGFDTFTPDSNTNDDYGCVLSSSPFELWLNQSDIDVSKIPDNYYITYGDNIYNYTITNPSTGKGTTINNFITNNYNIPDDGGSSGGDGGEGGDTINNWNISFGDFLIDIGNTIQTSITAVFVPSEVVIENYQTQLSDTLSLKLPFLTDLGEILNSFFVEIQDGNIYYSSDFYSDVAAYSDSDISTCDLGSYSSIYPCWSIDVEFFGQTFELTILDFSLYADSLYYVRLVVGAFVYITFFINLYRYLPKLIGGVGDMTNSVVSMSNKGDDD